MGWVKVSAVQFGEERSVEMSCKRRSGIFPHRKKREDPGGSVEVTGNSDRHDGIIPVAPFLGKETRILCRTDCSPQLVPIDWHRSHDELAQVIEADKGDTETIRWGGSARERAFTARENRPMGGAILGPNEGQGRDPL
jgi:hypothetical protein